MTDDDTRPDDPTTPSGDALFAEVQRALRELSAQMGAYTQAVGDRVGLAATDVNLLGFLHDIGPTATGSLADRTGLTPSAITRAIDRLEESGYVERHPDPDDRRRVIVSLTPLTERTLQPMFDTAVDSASGAMQSFDDHKLHLVLDFAGKATTVIHDATTRLREGPPAADSGVETTTTAPLGNVRRGHLSIAASNVPLVVTADAELGSQLFHVAASGVTPMVDVRGGKVKLSARGRRRRGKQGSIDVRVNPSVPWSFEAHGNGIVLDARLALLRLDALVVHGNQCQLDVDLPEPAKRSVGLKLHGNGVDARFRRASRTDVIAALRGHDHTLAVDGRPVERADAARATVWESEGFARNRPHYVLALNGSAGRVTIDRRD